MLTILSPAQGAILSDPAGRRADESLFVRVLLSKPGSVNGVPAVQEADGWACDVLLAPGANRLTAHSGEEIAALDVHYVPTLHKRYSVSVDDVLWSLADLTLHPESYPSLFDQPFFALFKRLHERFGMKVRLNLFRCMDNKFGLDAFGPFSLCDMTDRYRDEFRQNADWLRLAYHDEREFGGLMPADEMLPSVDSLLAEVRRFAGEEALDDLTTIHCVRLDPSAAKPLRERGIRCLMGLYGIEGRISYDRTREFSEAVHQYGFVRDAEQDMIYGELAIVLNKFLPEEIPPYLEKALASHPQSDFLELMIHEQYFYPQYDRYMPDFEERMTTALAWCQEKGYQPALTSEALQLEKYF